uniref:Uncharacterized protein n=1 Tax=Anguilla anguilla TaxID=7936 RepID=A0A0E9WFM3_ANGAN
MRFLKLCPLPVMQHGWSELGIDVGIKPVDS